MRALLLVVVTCLLVSASMTVVEGWSPECEQLKKLMLGGFDITPAERKFFGDNCLTDEQRKAHDEHMRNIKWLICTLSISPSCVRCKLAILPPGDDPKSICPGSYEIFTNQQAVADWYRANCCE